MLFSDFLGRMVDKVVHHRTHYSSLNLFGQEASCHCRAVCLAGLAELGWCAQIAMEIRFVLRNRLMAEAAPHRRPVEAEGGVADGTFLFALFIRKSTFPTHAECRIFLTFGLQSCLRLCCYFRFLCESLEHSISIFSATQRRLQLADLSQSF